MYKLVFLCFPVLHSTAQAQQRSDGEVWFATVLYTVEQESQERQGLGCEDADLLKESTTGSAERRPVVSMAKQADVRQQSGAHSRHVTVMCSCQAKLDQYTE